MKVAIVNDWLMKSAGAEKVFEQVLACYPESDVFSLFDFLPESDRKFLQGKKVTTSFLQHFPFAKSQYRNLLPLMPWAAQRFDLSPYDVVISLPHAVVKGVRTREDQLHIAYLQARNLKYIYDDREFYRGNVLKDKLIDWMVPAIQKWDQKAAQKPNVTVANSKFVQEWHFNRYGVAATVIYPPVDTSFFSKYYSETKENYFVTVGRLEPYKNNELIVAAFNRSGLPLKVLGDGTQLESLKAMAKDNIEFLGFRPKQEVAEYISKAKAFLFASREDFGIAPIEAQACGTPVVALGEGGALETIRDLGQDKPSGVLFYPATEEALIGALEKLASQDDSIRAEHCRENSLRFSVEHFRQEFTRLVEKEWEDFSRPK